MVARLKWPIAGVVLAIAVTSSMDATGLFAFSALPLLPLGAILWAIGRFSRRSVGFRLGSGRQFLLAALHPVVVIGLVAVLAIACGAADLSHARWPHEVWKFARVALATAIVVLVTEEGFFRGWLWASLERAGLSERSILVATSLSFAAWHWSSVILPNKEGFDLPAAQVPVFLVNAAVMGAAWGLLRRISGSVVVSSVAHGVWNGLAYVLFAFGSKVGALGVRNTAVFGPEVGVVGLGVNAAFVALLWRWSLAAPRRLP